MADLFVYKISYGRSTFSFLYNKYKAKKAQSKENLENIYIKEKHFNKHCKGFSCISLYSISFFFLNKKSNIAHFHVKGKYPNTNK